MAVPDSRLQYIFYYPDWQLISNHAKISLNFGFSATEISANPSHETFDGPPVDGSGRRIPAEIRAANEDLQPCFYEKRPPIGENPARPSLGVVFFICGNFLLM
jgi:hypothetical protein